MITYNLDLCIGACDKRSALTVKCHDTGVNFRVSFHVLRAGEWGNVVEPYSIPAETTAILKILKPDKHYCVTDGTVTRSQVSFSLPPQAFTVEGNSAAEVSLYDKGGKRITSATFCIAVESEVLSNNTGESESYVNAMAEQIKAAIDAEKDAVEAKNAAEQAAKTSGDCASHAQQMAADAASSAESASQSQKAAAKSEVNADESAKKAAQSAAQSGYMSFEIDDTGSLIFMRTTNVAVDFKLEEGELILYG